MIMSLILDFFLLSICVYSINYWSLPVISGIAAVLLSTIMFMESATMCCDLGLITTCGCVFYFGVHILMVFYFFYSGRAWINGFTIIYIIFMS